MPPKYVTVFDCKNEINEIRNEETISQHNAWNAYVKLLAGIADTDAIMLTLMLLNLNTGCADTDAELCIKTMSLCCTCQQTSWTF